MNAREWVVGDPDWESTIYVPTLDREDLCGAIHPRSYMCTRLPGHTGRHTAACSDGMVAAVWGEPA